MINKFIICTYSVICIMSVFTCNSSKAMKQSPEVLKIGNGGGFAGIEYTTIIHEDGSVSSKDTQFKKLKKDVVSQLLSNLNVLGIDQLEYSSPGNIYNYIEFSKGDSMKRIAWDPQNKEVPESLKLFYNNIIQILNRSKR